MREHFLKVYDTRMCHQNALNRLAHKRGHQGASITEHIFILPHFGLHMMAQRRLSCSEASKQALQVVRNNCCCYDYVEWL